MSTPNVLWLRGLNWQDEVVYINPINVFTIIPDAKQGYWWVVFTDNERVPFKSLEHYPFAAISFTKQD